MTIVKIDSEQGNETFKNIDKEELKSLIKYFSSVNIKMRQLDSESGKSIDMDFNEKQFDEEIK